MAELGQLALDGVMSPEQPGQTENAFKRCCMLSGEFDGSDRHYYLGGDFLNYH
jgi:hypothetical protein